MTTARTTEDPMPQQVDFFFDFVSPYTYLAQTQLPALKTRTGATFRLWPMHLLNLMKQVGNSPTTVLCANKMKYAGTDIGRWVSRYGVPFQFNPHVFAADCRSPALSIPARKSPPSPESLLTHLMAIVTIGSLT